MILPRACDVEKPFIWNNRFTILRGAEWFDTNFMLKFRGDGEVVQRRSPGKLWLLGPSVSVASTVKSISNKTLAGALTRLTGVREPELPGYCQWLFAMQRSSLWVRERVSFYRDMMLKYWESPLESDDHTLTLEQNHYADEHPKRLTRISAFNELEATRRIMESRTERHGTEGHIKLEQARHKKYARLTVDLGVPASLIGAWITSFLKQAIAEVPYTTREMEARFIPSASDADLTTAFQLLLNPPAKYAFAYFSDDSCVAIRTSTGLQFADVDISSCDKSHGALVFEALLSLFPKKFIDPLLLLMEQLRTRIKIRNVHDRQVSVVLRPREPVLYSGSTLTTLVNNIANLMIAWSIERLQIDTVEGVEAAARDVGYIVTVKRHTHPEQLQFLKHSPVLVNGEVRPVVNLGVFLRALGLSRVYVGSQPWHIEAMSNVASLIDSLYPTNRPDMLHNWRKRIFAAGITPTSTTIQLPYLTATKTKGPVTTIPIADVLIRYGLTSAPTFQALCERGAPGEVYAGSDIGSILALDYDLEMNNTVDGHFPEHNTPWLDNPQAIPRINL